MQYIKFQYTKIKQTKKLYINLCMYESKVQQQKYILNNRNKKKYNQKQKHFKKGEM